MQWQKSSLCRADSPMCVEIYGLEADYISIRNSRAPQKVVSFDREEYQRFIDGVKRGEFDLKTNVDEDAQLMMEQV
jgi:uncharacterized protein DUF397